jgi:hypothetical protein
MATSLIARCPRRCSGDSSILLVRFDGRSEAAREWCTRSATEQLAECLPGPG